MDAFGPLPPGVLEHPLVQYIPLAVRTLAAAACVPARPALRHLPDAEALAAACGELGVAPPPWESGRLLLLIRGATAERCWYRAGRAALLGSPRPAVAAVVDLPRRRIYKDRIHCILFDGEGRELCRCAVAGAML